MAAASAWVTASTPAWSSSATAASRPTAASSACCGTTPAPARCAMPMPATKSPGSARRSRGSSCRWSDLLPESDRAGVADHPLHAVAVAADAELLGPLDLLQRHLGAAAVGQPGEHAFGFFAGVGLQRDVVVGADLEVLRPGDVRAHQQGGAERQRDVGEAVEHGAVDAHLFAAEFAERHGGNEVAPEHVAVVFERLARVAVEVEVGIGVLHAWSPVGDRGEMCPGPMATVGDAGNRQLSIPGCTVRRKLDTGGRITLYHPGSGAERLERSTGCTPIPDPPATTWTVLPPRSPSTSPPALSGPSCATRSAP